MPASAMTHTIFDVMAALSSIAMSFWVFRWRLSGAVDRVQNAGQGYMMALVFGAIFGGYTLGTLNLWLSGIDGVGRSIVGAFSGAILFIEVYKKLRGVSGSTGLMFVPAFATTVLVGRWGCFFSGLEDQTYGVETSVPWGYDFGDGLSRHPVQLYESTAMFAFLIFALLVMRKRQPFFMANGFYMLAIWYGGQRFIWEFLKPYGTVMWQFNVFHLICAALVGYGLWMISRAPKPA